MDPRPYDKVIGTTSWVRREFCEFMSF